MIRSSHVPRSKTHRVLKHLGVLAALVPGCMVQQLSAQGSLTAPLAIHARSRSASGPRSSTAAGYSGAARVALPGSTAFGIAPFGLRTQTQDPIEGVLARPTVEPATDPFPSGNEFGDPSPWPTGNVFRDADSFDSSLQPADGFDAFSPARIRADRRNEESLFPLPPILTRGLGGSANGRSASSLFSLAALGRMMHGGLHVPLGSSGLRFDYEDNVRPGPKMAGGSRGGFASAMFTSTVLRNGMTLSAGALFGARSTLFPAGGGIRSLTSAAQKGSVPSLALRMSF